MRSAFLDAVSRVDSSPAGDLGVDALRDLEDREGMDSADLEF